MSEKSQIEPITKGTLLSTQNQKNQKKQIAYSTASNTVTPLISSLPPKTTPVSENISISNSDDWMTPSYDMTEDWIISQKNTKNQNTINQTNTNQTKTNQNTINQTKTNKNTTNQNKTNQNLSNKNSSKNLPKNLPNTLTPSQTTPPTVSNNTSNYIYPTTPISETAYILANSYPS